MYGGLTSSTELWRRISVVELRITQMMLRQLYTRKLEVGDTPSSNPINISHVLQHKFPRMAAKSAPNTTSLLSRVRPHI